MKTVAMDILFQGEQAEELREVVRNIVTDIAFDHTLNADIEITSWNTEQEPVVVKRQAI